MNSNLNVFKLRNEKLQEASAKDYKERLKEAVDEYEAALYDSEVGQDEFVSALAFAAEDTLKNYHEMQNMLKRHPELKDETLFKNIKQQYDDLLDVDENHDFTVAYYHSILNEYADQEAEIQKNDVNDDVKLNKEVM